MKFKELGLSEDIVQAIDFMGFEHATPIQEAAIPAILEGRDIIGCAQTGTGKTAAFILPLLEKMLHKPNAKINALIIVPTRELAVQIDQQIQGLAYFTSVGSYAVYGGGTGKNWQMEKDALSEGADIIIATPGKLLSHLQLGYVDFSDLQYLVLDEADRMLDMGFSDDLNQIFKHLPEKRQNLLFSATMAEPIRRLARKMLHEPIEINLALSKPAEGVKQSVYAVFDEQKTALLTYILQEEKNRKRVIVFTSKKSSVGSIVRNLKRAKILAQGISSDLEQSEREETLRGFKSGRIPVLVATDVMSRGIDIKEIDLVINFDAPSDAEDYVHRVGRTARANTKGEAITLINPKDMSKFNTIEKLIEQTVPRAVLPESLGAAPEWVVSRPKKKKGNHRKFQSRKKTDNANQK
ncbi:MAG: DEAD/DEAH box helicase [Crocinitomicaceae bacterium]|nr:DEAD/DEAH box helicase [Crocinitomicaceae bacterium]